MTDLLLNAICTLLLIFTTTTIVVCILQCSDRRLARAYVTLAGCVFGWLLSVILYRLTESSKLATYLDNLSFPFIAFLPVALFVLTLHFYSEGKHISKKLILLMSIIPSCTSLIALYPPLNFLLRYDHVMVSMAPLHVAVFKWSWWFYVHAVYSYSVTLTSVAVAIVQHRKRPSGYTIPSGLFVGSILFTLVGNLFAIMNTSEVDFTMLSSSLCMIILYISIMNNPGVEYLAIAQKQLFNKLDNPVFIMSKQRQVMEVNAAALNWLDAIGFSGKLPYGFEQVLSCLNAKGGVVKECFLQTGDQNVFLQLHGEPVVYTLAERQVVDQKGQKMGSYINLTDITHYSKMITRLEQEADTDQLTKIGNRRAYEQKCVEMDVVENLPLSVMIADVNGLKKVNDQFGHHCGDELLRIVARILTRLCPENAFAARVGGDEFALIAPRCTYEDISVLMENTNESLRQEGNELFVPSVAFGAVTKTHTEQDLQKLISEADIIMYQQKNRTMSCISLTSAPNSGTPRQSNSVTF